MSNKKIVLGIIAGASIGAIAAILLSPGKGSELRQKISDATTDWATSIKDCVVNLFTGKNGDASTKGESTAGNQGMNLNTMG